MMQLYHAKQELPPPMPKCLSGDAMVRNNLKHWRHKFEMTQTEFAAMLGIDRQQYNRYEHQAIQPTLETALKLAKKLNIPVEQVFYLESPEE